MAAEDLSDNLIIGVIMQELECWKCFSNTNYAQSHHSSIVIMTHSFLSEHYNNVIMWLEWTRETNGCLCWAWVSFVSVRYWSGLSVKLQKITSQEIKKTAVPESSLVRRRRATWTATIS